MNLVINKCVTAVKVAKFSGHYLRNRSTSDIGVLGYIDIFQHKEHSPEVVTLTRGTSCILITNLMHWLLFIHKILFFSTCFEPQVLIFRRIQLYSCSIWTCHSLWEFLVACRYTAWVRNIVIFSRVCIDIRQTAWQAIPVQDCSGPANFRSSRLPDFKTIGIWRW